MMMMCVCVYIETLTYDPPCSSQKLGVETHTDRGSLRPSAVGETRELALLIFDFLV